MLQSYINSFKKPIQHSSCDVAILTVLDIVFLANQTKTGSDDFLSSLRQTLNRVSSFIEFKSMYLVFNLTNIGYFDTSVSNIISTVESWVKSKLEECPELNITYSNPTEDKLTQCAIMTHLKSLNDPDCRYVIFGLESNSLILAYHVGLVCKKKHFLVLSNPVLTTDSTYVFDSLDMGEIRTYFDSFLSGDTISRTILPKLKNDQKCYDNVHIPNTKIRKFKSDDVSSDVLLLSLLTDGCSLPPITNLDGVPYDFMALMELYKTFLAHGNSSLTHEGVINTYNFNSFLESVIGIISDYDFSSIIINNAALTNITNNNNQDYHNGDGSNTYPSESSIRKYYEDKFPELFITGVGKTNIITDTDTTVDSNTVDVNCSSENDTEYSTTTGISTNTTSISTSTSTSTVTTPTHPFTYPLHHRQMIRSDHVFIISYTYLDTLTHLLKSYFDNTTSNSFSPYPYTYAPSLISLLQFKSHPNQLELNFTKPLTIGQARKKTRYNTSTGSTINGDVNTVNHNGDNTRDMGSVGVADGVADGLGVDRVGVDSVGVDDDVGVDENKMDDSNIGDDDQYDDDQDGGSIGDDEDSGSIGDDEMDDEGFEEVDYEEYLYDEQFIDSDSGDDEDNYTTTSTFDDEDSEYVFPYQDDPGYHSPEYMSDDDTDTNDETIYDRHPKTKLMFAAKNNNIKQLKYLLRSGHDINDRYGEYDYQRTYTVLFTSIKDKVKIETLKFLLDSGADVKKYNVGIYTEDNESILMYACKLKCDINIIKLLISYGAEVELGEKDAKVTDWYTSCNDLENILTPLYHAIDNEMSVEVVQLLLDHGANPNTTGYANTPLLMKANSLEVVKLLIKYGANVNALDKGGRTILMRNNKRDVEYLKLLIENGVDVNAVDMIEKSVLMHYVEANNVECVKYLITLSADIHYAHRGGRTVLSYVCPNHGLEMTKLLVEQGVDVNVKFDLNQNMKDISVLALLVCNNADINIIRYLINVGADVTQRYDDGRTILTYACLAPLVTSCDCLHYNTPQLEIVNHNLDVMQLLLDSYEECKSKDKNLNPFLTTSTSLTDISTHTSNTGVSSSIAVKSMVNLASNSNYTPLIIASCYNQDALLSQDKIRFLLKNGADPNVITNDTQMCALEHAILNVSYGGLDSVHLLIEGGANVDIFIKKGFANDTYPILSYFFIFDQVRESNRYSHYFNYSFIKMLIERGANVNHVDSNGASTLKALFKFHQANHFYNHDYTNINNLTQHFKIAKLLLDEGVLLDSVGDDLLVDMIYKCFNHDCGYLLMMLFTDC